MHHQQNIKEGVTAEFFDVFEVQVVQGHDLQKSVAFRFTVG
jgi:hypothetical protein